MNNLHAHPGAPFQASMPDFQHMCTCACAAFPMLAGVFGRRV